jgi:transaldolase
MSETYLSRLVTETPSRVWVNNPTVEEIGLAQANGAVGCTTNPAYGGGLLKRAPDEVKPAIAEACREHPDASVIEISDVVQQKLVARIAERFRPLFDSSGGQWGLVSIQGAPEADTDGEHIWGEAEAGHAIGPNATPKIPATLPGLVAFERVVEAGWPVIVTEVFSLDQVEFFCDRYAAVTEKTGVKSRFLMSPITGILGDHLKKLSKQQGLDVPDRDLELAGIYLSRRCAALVAERAYPVTLLFGGARIMEDLTGLIGEPHCATINWSTFQEVLDADPALENTIGAEPDPAVMERLLSAFPDVWKGWELGRLSPEEFEEFGPVQHFRDNFIAGWQAVQAAVEVELQGVEVGA